MHKCERCASPATVHITEILSEGKFEEHHVCEPCYPKYVHDTQNNNNSSKALASESPELEEALFGQQECPSCGLKFVDFRNKHRLGCPMDYQVFQTELRPLLENIHGETRHVGKTPRRLPKIKKEEARLAECRQKLKRAIEREDYEEAAHLRDQIKTLEEA